MCTNNTVRHLEHHDSKITDNLTYVMILHESKFELSPSPYSMYYMQVARPDSMNPCQFHLRKHHMCTKSWHHKIVPVVSIDPSTTTVKVPLLTVATKQYSSRD